MKNSENVSDFFVNLGIIQIALFLINGFGIFALPLTVVYLPILIVFGLAYLGLIAGAFALIAGIVKKINKNKKKKRLEKISQANKQKQLSLTKAKKPDTKTKEKEKEEEEKSVKEELIKLRNSFAPQKEEPVKVKVLKKQAQ